MKKTLLLTGIICCSAGLALAERSTEGVAFAPPAGWTMDSTTSQMMVELAPMSDPEVFAKDHGLTVVRALSGAANSYVFEAGSTEAAMTAMESDARVASAVPNAHTRFVRSAFVPDDPFYAPGVETPYGQWHLYNDLGLPHIDAPGAWADDYTGTGVLVGVIDDGVQTAHPDLAANYNATHSYDFGQADADPNPAGINDIHGTAVAGVIAAVGGNTTGVTGVAPAADFAALRIDFANQTLAMFTDAITYHSSGADTSIKIKNHSYSNPIPFDAVLTGQTTALETSAAAGTIHVFAAGNERAHHDTGFIDLDDDGNYDFNVEPALDADVNKKELLNNTNAIVAASIGADGVYADYSNYGASVFCTAPSSTGSHSAAILTTDRTGGIDGYNGPTGITDKDYTAMFGGVSDPAGARGLTGTSAAAPIVAGVLAMGKQANASLDTRLAKHMLAETCWQVDATDGEWITNAAGNTWNPNYGFGLINATSFISQLNLVSSLSAVQELTIGTTAVNLSVTNAVGRVQEFELSPDDPEDPGYQETLPPLEDIEVTLNITHTYRGDIEVQLTSPQGTTCTLLYSNGRDSFDDISWTALSNAFWGEDVRGTWQLHVYDTYYQSDDGQWVDYAVKARLGEVAYTSTPPEAPAVTPATNFVASGRMGGPFSPETKTYTLAAGADPIDFTVSSPASWVDITPATGTIPASGTVDVTVSFNEDTEALPGRPGEPYIAPLYFANDAGGTPATRSVELTVSNSGILSVTPETNLTAQGPFGGPFPATSQDYTLENIGNQTMDWSVTSDEPWVDVALTEVFGSLSSGSSTQVTVSLDAAEAALLPEAAEPYVATVSFINNNNGNGNTTRTFTLTVEAGAQMDVTPATDFAAEGPVGGPFTPSQTQYTVANVGPADMSWTASSTANWVTISPAAGSLSPSSSIDVTVTINANANSLPGQIDPHVAPITFTNTTNGVGNASRDVLLTVGGPELAVTPQTTFDSTGPQGGPFSPASAVYTIENVGDLEMSWSVTDNQGWVSIGIPELTGTLAPGASTQVTVDINSQANALLTKGTPYVATVSFLNNSNGKGNTTRAVNLTVLEPATLVVEPAGGFSAGGPTGGPFNPTSKQYTLSNTGGSALNWTAAALGGTWLDVTPASGTLQPDEDVLVTVSLTAGANGLAGSPTPYTDQVLFDNTTNGIGSTTRDVSLSVGISTLIVSPSEDFNTSGPEGGPFSPAQMIYTLSNPGDDPIDWTAAGGTGLAVVTPSSGTIPGSGSTQVTVSINGSLAAILPARPSNPYADPVSFTNVTNGLGDTTRTLILDVLPPAPAELEVSPETDFVTSGPGSGPFSPPSIVYTLSNVGDSALNWSAGVQNGMVTVTPASGSIPGSSSVQVTVAVDTTITPFLADGVWPDTVTFTNLNNGVGNTTRGVTVTIGATLDPPVVVAAVSRVTHGGAGPFDLDLTSGSAIEPRQGGPDVITVTFDMDVEGMAGDTTDVALSGGTVDSVSIVGDTVTIDVSAMPDQQWIDVTFPGITGVGGSVASSDTVTFGYLEGDAAASGAVNIFDLFAVRNSLALPVDASTFRNDIKPDGGFNIFDLFGVRNKLPNTLPPQ